MKHYISFFVAALVCTLSSCDKQLDQLAPHDVNFEAQQFATKAGYLKATIGNYVALTAATELGSAYNMDYLWLNLSEFRGNDVRLITPASNNSLQNAKEIDAFTFTNSALKDYSYTYYYWRAAYKALLGVNTVLQNIPANETDVDILNSEGENLFLRSVLFFDMVRLYGRPYYQSPETNLGIPLILEPITDISDRPSRATVKATYAQIVNDLLQAASLMTEKKDNSYAGKYAAYALLSRVYLYMGGTMSSPVDSANQKAIQYADSAIANGGYTLLQGTAYSNYYTTSNQTNTETIWALNHSVNQSITVQSLQYSTQYNTGSWYRPSPDFLSLLTIGDLRKNHYKVNKYPNNTTDSIECEKYGFNYNGAYSNAPVHYLRLAEMYLNRAEAEVKTGDNTDALADLNVIRVRAGLAAAIGLTGQALFNEILNQRRIELAFEGHGSFDYFRNGLPMVRDYNSFGSNALTIQATDPQVVLSIPQDEINANPNLTQNNQ